MLKNILKLESTTKLSVEQQKSINGGWGSAGCFPQCGPGGGVPNLETGRCACY